MENIELDSTIDSRINSMIDSIINDISNIEIKNKISDNNSLEKQDIINLFLKNVKNKEIKVDSYNISHCGKEGHWLEKQMNIKANNKIYQI